MSRLYTLYIQCILYIHCIVYTSGQSVVVVRGREASGRSGPSIPLDLLVPHEA